jgi:hypothetical protein
MCTKSLYQELLLQDKSNDNAKKIQSKNSVKKISESKLKLLAEMLKPINN